VIKGSRIQAKLMQLYYYRTVKNFGGEKTLANHNNSPTFFRQFSCFQYEAPQERKLRLNCFAYKPGSIGKDIDNTVF